MHYVSVLETSCSDHQDHTRTFHKDIRPWLVLTLLVHGKLMYPNQTMKWQTELTLDLGIPQSPSLQEKHRYPLLAVRTWRSQNLLPWHSCFDPGVCCSIWHPCGWCNAQRNCGDASNLRWEKKHGNNCFKRWLWTDSWRTLFPCFLISNGIV